MGMKVVDRRRMTFRQFLEKLANGWGWREPFIPKLACYLLMEAFHPPEEGLGEKEVEVEYRRGGYRDEDKMTYYYEYEWRVKGVPLPSDEGIIEGNLLIAPLWERSEEGLKKVGFRIYYRY